MSIVILVVIGRLRRCRRSRGRGRRSHGRRRRRRVRRHLGLVSSHSN